MKAYMIFTKSDREPAIRNIYRTFSAAKRVADKINSDKHKLDNGTVIVVCADNWYEEVTPE